MSAYFFFFFFCDELKYTSWNVLIDARFLKCRLGLANELPTNLWRLGSHVDGPGKHTRSRSVSKKEEKAINWATCQKTPPTTIPDEQLGKGPQADDGFPDQSIVPDVLSRPLTSRTNDRVRSKQAAKKALGSDFSPSPAPCSNDNMYVGETDKYQSASATSWSRATANHAEIDIITK